MWGKLKHLKAKLLAMGLLLFIAAGAWAVAAYTSFEQQTRRYASVAITDSREEVRYRLGYPDAVVGEPAKGGPWERFPPVYSTADDRNSGDPLPKGTDVQDYLTWVWDSGVFVQFSDKSEHIVAITCAEGVSQNAACPPLLGIRVGDREEEVQRKLGRPTEAALADGIKTMTYADIGTTFQLTEGKVYSLALEHKKRGNRMGGIRRFLMHFSPWGTSVPRTETSAPRL